jgi:hypothetical protein
MVVSGRPFLISYKILKAKMSALWIPFSGWNSTHSILYLSVLLYLIVLIIDPYGRWLADFVPAVIASCTFASADLQSVNARTLLLLCCAILTPTSIPISSYRNGVVFIFIFCRMLVAWLFWS